MVNFTVAPETKLVPVTEVIETEELLVPLVGLIAVTVGAGRVYTTTSLGSLSVPVSSAKYPSR